MPSNINFDDSLLEEALKIGGHKYKKDAFNAALKEYVERHKRLQVLDLFGTISIKVGLKKARKADVLKCGIGS